MHDMEELKEMLCDELENITKQGKITANSLDAIDKLTHSIKSIDTIIVMSEEGYSNRGSYESSYEGSYGSSYARDRRGRNSEGSYRTRRDGGRDQRYSREYRGYSRDLKENLEDLMDRAETEKERKMLEKWVRQLDEN